MELEGLSFSFLEDIPYDEAAVIQAFLDKYIILEEEEEEKKKPKSKIIFFSFFI